jgi:hypothetical protein
MSHVHLNILCARKVVAEIRYFLSCVCKKTKLHVKKALQKTFLYLFHK